MNNLKKVMDSSEVVMPHNHVNMAKINAVVLASLTETEKEKLSSTIDSLNTAISVDNEESVMGVFFSLSTTFDVAVNEEIASQIRVFNKAEVVL